MYRKKRNETKEKRNYAKCGRGGFTLVELCIVLALLAIVTTMIVSFSVLMSEYAKENEATYEFLEDCAALEDVLRDRLAENDTGTCEFSVVNGTLTLTENGTDKTVTFADGVLLLGEERLNSFDTVEGISFAANDKLIKCTVYRTDAQGVRMESCFVLSLRVASIVEKEVVEHA